MKNNVLEYKGYHASVSYESETNTLRGVIEGINDFVDFECDDLNDVVREFQNAVDDYLEFCKNVGKDPEKEYKGSFNIRIKPELHKLLALEASCNGESLNRTVERVIENYFSTESVYDHNEPEHAASSAVNKSRQITAPGYNMAAGK